MEVIQTQLVLKCLDKNILSANLTKVPKQKDGPLWLAHSRGALWRPKSFPCSLPYRGCISRHQSIPENSTCSGKVDDVLGSEMRKNLMKPISGECGWVSPIFFTSKRTSRGMAGSSLRLFFCLEPFAEDCFASVAPEPFFALFAGGFFIFFLA